MKTRAKAKAKAALPTKEELKAARAVLRRHLAERVKKHRIRSRRFATPADRDFYTWRHDMGIVLQSAARDLSLPPAEVAERARATADSMAALTYARKPASDDADVTYTGRRSAMPWRSIWQETFDMMIHYLASRTEIGPDAVVDRARRIADAAMPILKRRYKR